MNLKPASRLKCDCFLPISSRKLPLRPLERHQSRKLNAMRLAYDRFVESGVVEWILLGDMLEASLPN